MVTRRGGVALVALVTLLAALVPGAFAAEGEPPAAVAVSRLADRVLDASARGNVSYGATANVASYQQNALVTHGAYQYTAWYAADRRAVLARRTLAAAGADGPWEPIFLDAVLYSDDSHNNITLGVSASDGRLHVALATHTRRIRYLRSLPGVAAGVGEWSSRSFERLRADLPGAPRAPQWWTYPAFENVAGGLLLTWRDGSAMGGGQVLARYDDNASGTWTYLGRFSGPEGEWAGAYGTSGSRYGYLHGFAENPRTGDLEITWTWRENATVQDPRCVQAPANRDLMYARSPDGGMTWLSQSGEVIARTGTEDVITRADDPLTLAVAIDVTSGMINQETQAVDSVGRIHVVTSQLDAEALEEVGGCLDGDYYAQRAQYAQPVHHWRDDDGVWRSAQLPLMQGRGGRSSLTFTADDTAVLVLPDGRIAVAGAASGWSDWVLAFDAADTDSASEVVVDRDRVLREGVLTVAYQEASATMHAPSAFRVADFAVGSSAPHGAKDSGVGKAPLPYAGSAPAEAELAASSAQPNHPAQFAADGRTDSYWLSGEAAVSLEAGVEWVSGQDALTATAGGATPLAPQWLTMTWPQARWVDQVQVGGGATRGPRDYLIEGWGPSGWVALGSVSAQTSMQVTPVSRAWVSGVRLTITAGNDADSVQVSEMSAHGAAPVGSVSFGVPRREFTARTWLPVTVPGPGRVRLDLGPANRRHAVDIAASVTGLATGPATVELLVRPRGTAASRVSARQCRRTSAKRLRATVPVSITYTPLGGTAVSVNRTVRLVRACGR